MTSYPVAADGSGRGATAVAPTRAEDPAIAPAPARLPAEAALTLRAVAVSRLIVWATGLAVLAVFGRSSLAVETFDQQRLTEPFHGALANLLAGQVARWDSAWYLKIAHVGYFSRPSSAFYPLYPLLVRVASPLFGSGLVAGAAISIAALAGALYLLYRLARLDLTEHGAGLTVMLVALFPTALYFSAVYTESLYLLLSVGAVFAARLGRWRCASVLGCAAALSRPNGLLVLLPLALIYLYGPRADAPAARPDRRWWPRYPVTPSALWLALVPIGTLAYMGYLAAIWHSPLAAFQAESDFARQYGGPFGGVFQALILLPGDLYHVAAGSPQHSFPWDPVSGSLHRIIDLAFLAWAAVGLIVPRRRLPVAYHAYALVLLAAATSYPHFEEPLASLSRYLLAVFPAFIGWAILLADRRVLTRIALGLSAVFLAGFSALWAIWGWIA